MTPARAMDAILKEFNDASASHSAFHSAHEGYAVILEELEELWEEVMKKAGQRSTREMAGEAKQVAAMAMRFMVDMCLEDDV